MFRDGTTRHGERDGPLATAILSWLTRIIHIIHSCIFSFFSFFSFFIYSRLLWVSHNGRLPSHSVLKINFSLFYFQPPKKITFCKKKENFIYTHGRTYIIWIQLGIWKWAGRAQFLRLLLLGSGSLLYRPGGSRTRRMMDTMEFQRAVTRGWWGEAKVVSSSGR